MDLGAAASHDAMARALAIVGQRGDIRARAPLPLREVRTRAVELLAQRALASGLELAILDSPVYRAHMQERRGA